MIGANENILNKKRFEEEFKKYVLLNFFISILKNKLVIKIQDTIINSKNIEMHIRESNSYRATDVGEMQEYYYLLTSEEMPDVKIVTLDSNEFGKEYGFNDGECTLYIKKGDIKEKNLNRKVLMTRETGMRLFEQGNINGHIQFTGVMYISGEKMNKVFREMEPPAHNGWHPKRCGDKADKYEKIRKEFIRYIGNQVNSFIKEDVSEEIEAFHVANYIKDFTGNKNEETRKDELSVSLKEIGIVEINQKKVKKRKTKDIVNVSDDGEADSTKLKAHSGHAKIKKGKMDAKEDVEGKEKGYKEGKVVMQLLLPNDISKGELYYKFKAPKKAKRIKLVFNIIGEQGSDALNINKTIIRSEGKTRIGKADNKAKVNEVFIDNIEKNQLIELNLSTNLKFNCSMEVKYYAAKK